MKRKILSLFTIICLVFALTGIDTFAATLTISGQNYPSSTFTKGKTFSIYGTITSTNTIKSVEVGVWNASGTRETGKSVSISAKSYNIHNLDNYVLFDKLTAGTKYYKIIAQDNNGRVTLVNYKFTVTAPSSLSISNYNTPPSTLNKGSAFSIYGTISSANTIKSVHVGVYNSSGSLETGKTVSVSVKSYNVSNLDNYILFDKLSAGSKTYKITATDQNGTTTLVNKSFTVVAPSANYKFPVPGYSYGSCQLNCSCSIHNGKHNGVDISAPNGTKIIAAHSGTVTIVSTCNYNTSKPNGCSCGCGGRGNCIKISGNGIETTYMHMSKISVSNGASVNVGDKIGEVGTTGWSTGAHLHFEVRLNGTLKNPPTVIPN